MLSRQPVAAFILLGALANPGAHAVQRIWPKSLPLKSVEAHAVAQQRLYVADADRVVAINVQTGEIQWQQVGRENYVTSSLTPAGDAIVRLSRSKYPAPNTTLVEVLAAATGEILLGERVSALPDFRALEVDGDLLFVTSFGETPQGPFFVDASERRVHQEVPRDVIRKLSGTLTSFGQFVFRWADGEAPHWVNLDQTDQGKSSEAWVLPPDLIIVRYATDLYGMDVPRPPNAKMPDLSSATALFQGILEGERMRRWVFQSSSGMARAAMSILSDVMVFDGEFWGQAGMWGLIRFNVDGEVLDKKPDVVRAFASAGQRFCIRLNEDKPLPERFGLETWTGRHLSYLAIGESEQLTYIPTEEALFVARTNLHTRQVMLDRYELSNR